MEIARDAWGHVPDWIALLVTACDAPKSSQAKVASRLGITAGVVSCLIRNNYAGSMARMEDIVRDVLAPSAVQCPALGEIGSEVCLLWRQRASRLTSSSPVAVRMFRACNDCPRHRKPEEEDA